MAIEKTLLLKGLAGVAALGGAGGVGGVVIKNKLDERAAEEKKKEDEQNKQKELEGKKKEVNEKLKTLGIKGCDLEDKDVTSPTTFTKECQLTKDQFQAINFSNKGDQEVNVEGWTDNKTVTLNISNKPGEGDGIKFLFKKVEDDLTITGGNGQDNKFSIKAGKETEFEEKPEGKLSKIVDETLKEKLKNYNKKLETLSLPSSCRFDETEDEKKLECEIKGSELKTIKFSNKADNNELSLEGLSSSQKIKLIIDREGTGESESLKYKFKNETSSKITIKGTTGDPNNFSIKASSETEFEEKPEGKLKKKFDDTISTKLKGYNSKFQTLSLPSSCRFDDTEDEKRLECEIKGSELKTVNFSNKGESALTLKGINDSEKIKLIIDREEGGGSETLKYKFKNDNSSKITITGTTGDPNNFSIKASSETEFEEKSGKLSKIISNQETSTKLKEHNKKLEKLSLPDGCIFDVTEPNTSLECDVTTANIIKIKFSNKGNNDLTISEGSDFTGLKLNIDGSKDNLKFIFKKGNKKIKLTDNSKHVIIKQSEDSEFEFKNEALHKIPKKVNELAKKVDLVCEYGDSGDGGECKFNGENNYLNVAQGASSGAVGVSFNNANGGKDKVKFSFQEDQSDYEGGVKFTFTGDEIGNGGATLETGKGYEVKTDNEISYLSKKTK